MVEIEYKDGVEVFQEKLMAMFKPFKSVKVIPCQVDGENSTVIAWVDKENSVIIPIFVTPTPGMCITDSEGEEPSWFEETNG